MKASLVLCFISCWVSVSGLNPISKAQSDQLAKECGQSPSNRFKILHGNRAKPKQFPMAADIAWAQEGYYGFDSHRCGGVLITKRHVLTAAHCVHKAGGCTPSSKIDPRNLVVHFGSIKEVSGERIKVKDFVFHQDWYAKSHNCPTNGGDLAILELEKEVPDHLFKSGEVGFGCLPKKNLKTKKYPLTAFGWGKTEGTEANDVLLFIKLRHMNYYKCEKNWGKGNLAADAFCTEEKKTNVCGGDSGGPLMQKGDNRQIVIGLVSSGSLCEQMLAAEKSQGIRAFPGAVFTNVRKHLKYICKHTGACYSK